MPQYRYQSLTSDGRTSQGVLDAPDRTAALRQIMQRGETPTTVESSEDGDTSKNSRASLNGRVQGAQTHVAGRRSQGLQVSQSIRKQDMAALIREIATALEAGLPLVQSLRTVRRQATSQAMEHMLDYLIDRVESGAPLYQAAHDYGKPFDELITGMLRAADASGDMSVILHQLADLLERQLEIRREVSGALFYPAIVTILLIGSVIVLITFLVPSLLKPLMGNEGFTMPLPTKILVNAADLIAAYWLYCVVGMLAVAVLWRAWVAVPENRLKFDRFKLSLPIFGRVLRDVAVARFTRTLGTLVASGLPILDALRITNGTLGNRALMAAIDDVQDKVTGGKTIAEPLERSGLFPPLLVQIINLGERSGRLEEMLAHAAGAFDRQVNTSLKMMTRAIGPVLIIVMAAAAGFVLLAILLPLLEMQSMVG